MMGKSPQGADGKHWDTEHKDVETWGNNQSRIGERDHMKVQATTTGEQANLQMRVKKQK